MKKICIVTGTRAEYGLLKPIIEKVKENSNLELQLVVTGAHLSSEFGETYREIEEDGYPIVNKIEMLMSSDTAVGITKSMGIALLGFSECFEVNKPDMIVILGDRYEMLAVAEAAMIAGIPIAHIGGGEITEGAYDDAIRHSITKMSQLHFTSTKEYRNRVIQMGEQPDRVYHVGALGVENIKQVPLLSKADLQESLGFLLDTDTIMVTYHPVTLEELPSEVQFQNLLDAFGTFQNLKVIFTKANADTDGRIINKMIDEYVEKNQDRCIAFSSLGQVRYLSALQFCKAVVGNSSSGIIEAPSFGIPTVDIGDRQRGRLAAQTVIHCDCEVADIEKALQKALSQEFVKEIEKYSNPYEGTNTSQTIVDKIMEKLECGLGVKKKFYDIKCFGDR